MTEHSAGERAVQELLGTPVGRRWLLRTGALLGAGAALSSFAPPSAAAAAAAAGAADRPAAKGTRRTVLHFTLKAVVGVDQLEVRTNGTVTKLTAHTASSRRRLRSRGSLWRKLDRSQLTHYAELGLPRHRGLPLFVSGITTEGERVLLLQHVYAPADGLRTVARAAFHLQHSYRSVLGSDFRLQQLGLDPVQVRSIDEVLDLDTVVDYEATAIAVTMMHPNVATVNTTGVAATKSLLGQSQPVSTFGQKMLNMHNNGQNWASEPYALNADGTKTQIKVGETTTTFQTITLSNDKAFQSIASAGIIDGIHGVRDTSGLGTVNSRPIDAAQDKSDTATWHVGEGVLPVETPYQPPVGAAAAVTATVQNPGLLYGTYTTINGGFSNGQQGLKIYNNYVRWVSIYVQYLDVSGNNLSIATGPVTFPDTTYAKFVGLLPQIFTLLGIPIWDTNTQTVTLNFPPGATSARILYCGLGNDAVGGGWRQYFPAAAYPSDAIAPTLEVELAGIITGLFTIGMTAFALLTDIDAASTWGEIRDLLEGLSSTPPNQGEVLVEIAGLIEQIVARPPYLAASDVAASLIASGAATSEDISANGGSLSNIWGILAGLGALIPKIIFNPSAAGLVSRAAQAILGVEVDSKLIQAIPGISEVVEVIAIVGDAATLAEAIGETLASPWVIGNTVSLSYPVTVAVSFDPRSTTWPATGRSWRLESTIDGSSALTSLTSEFNPDGNSTADIEVTTTAPFGGTTITWSLVVQDADGHQVGAGSLQLKNDDPNNTPSDVAFSIVEVPAAVDAATVFSRTITTSWNPAGYTWDAAVPPDEGTAANSAVQEVTGVTVSTRLGVAGIVWKQNDLYWLRGVPVGENGATISVGGATRQGYSRRPFLLFDALVGPSDIGNHVLLEPDDTDPGYHIRALSIDPAAGGLSWDSTTSLGYFPLSIDAAGLCASGWVVAASTTSGRLGAVLPVATPLPPLAAYSAGPGTATGLLSSPIALAVTNRGVVVALESNVSSALPYQLSAFDLLGNPARFFGSQSSPAFTLPLAVDRTYLDIGIDGSDDLYLLSNAGDNSQPADYRIDVYQRDGTPIATLSPGANIPHLAVDYWRSIFAANYTALLDTTTNQPHIDPALNVVEPSISRWDPAG